MNTKQKTIISIYVFVSFLVTCFWLYEYFSIINGQAPLIQYGKSLFLSGDEAQKAAPAVFKAAVIADTLSLIILGIPTYILHKLWADKK